MAGLTERILGTIMPRMREISTSHLHIQETRSIINMVTIRRAVLIEKNKLENKRRDLAFFSNNRDVSGIGITVIGNRKFTNRVVGVKIKNETIFFLFNLLKI